jgi:hypothetical protein
LKRRLSLNTEHLTELTPADLTEVVGAGASRVNGCPLSAVLPRCVTDLCV